MTFVWILLSFIICGFVCMWLFAWKQRSLLCGFLVGSLLGLIGLVIALLLPKKEMLPHPSFLLQTADGWRWQRSYLHRQRTKSNRDFVLTASAPRMHIQGNTIPSRYQRKFF